MQRLLNKLWSLALSHAQASAGLKLLVPMGSVEDISQLEQDWANPNAVIEIDSSQGEPHYPAPQALASEFYKLIQQCEHYIDFTFGLPEMMHGFSDKAPETVRGTERMIALGTERPKSKLRDIEFSINRLGKVLYNFCKGHYTYKLEQLTESKNIYVFDPIPENYIFLKKIFKQCNIYKYALSDKSSISKFKIPIINKKLLHTRGKLNFDIIEKNEDGYKTIDVECKTLDLFVENEKIHRLNFIKIDVEGNELKVLQGGIQSIKKGQRDAAKSIGLNRYQEMRFIVFPQALRIILPAIGNQFVYVLKMSSLVSIIGLADLTRKANELVVSVYRPLEVYTFLVFEYLILILIISYFVRKLENKLKN